MLGNLQIPSVKISVAISLVVWLTNTVPSNVTGRHCQSEEGSDSIIQPLNVSITHR